MEVVTQKTIARALGLSQGTVSLSLRNDPRIPLTTRKNVIAKAEELGYLPDPVLSALIEHRRRSGQPRHRSTIAFLAPTSNPKTYWTSPFAEFSLKGCKLAAKQLGYSLDVFEMTAYPPKALVRTLINRGIRGIVVGPYAEHLKNFPFESGLKAFASVIIGRQPADTYNHHVSPNHFWAVEHSWEEASKRGYKRMGFINLPAANWLSAGRWQAAYRHLRTINENGALKGMEIFHRQKDSFDEWFRKNQPDVMISPDIWSKQILISSGLKIPSQMGFITLSVPPDDEQNTGIDQNPLRIGQQSVYQLDLILKTRSNDDFPLTTLITGKWKDGKTLPLRG